MFVYFTDGTCINDSEIYGVKAKHEQNKYVVEVTIKPPHVLTTTVSVQFKKEVFDDPNLANQYLNHNFDMPPYF
ncbi:hypothetical protein [Acinetobacter nosocomialis]|uniref:hypothetical protein n=1 Tax=Acinetobacter nosocomialis TaxID=106654 RepID=UPI0026F44417|nr:hypothetical protein [Acinetobacter nosocomialis]MDO7437072.1 hypothetical protein [Acinetobacter nosocomialis]